MDRSERDHFVPHSMHIPYTPDGLGTYSAEALCFYKTNAKAIPLVLEAIKSSLVKPGSVFTIVDYGTADGGTSIPLMYESVKAIREKLNITAREVREFKGHIVDLISCHINFRS
ncbi:hypothetical protein AC249_AIPGENE18852 [Exaiptasia diaphana]|nr:hypothetical protein AC249_AIPGENE18852 [Exaiptasia diaphana]